MKKLILALSLFSLLACGENEIQKSKGDDKMVRLTKAEAANKTEEELLGAFLSKAVYKEANLKLKTKEDKERMDSLKRRAVNDYYILSLANERVDVSEEEMLEIYNKNKEGLEGKTLEEVKPAIKNLIYEAKLKNEIADILEEVKEKYSLDQKIEEIIKNKK
ncbi:hypothetical protein PM10SUCC1_05010 [Propionigenium maris DSM 9537]|uniref:Lipoprotein n=1 Tax=Propionigenium maris DSM 9537 TaxID=1123000 RepID=A0A9W6GJI0_9FUSO|nr:hypothetical protein [Propionigenium maris]GLI54986.1 hypothetical protein PM10SUCC1_05010 [Propionigenium maris DSM 9537]